MDSILLCLDSGTTAVKAAAFDRHGRLLGTVERENRALRRDGPNVEQDMEITRDDALAVLRACAVQAGGTVGGIVVAGQGDGLWPVDVAGQPVGRAFTWLDGRSRPIIAELDGAGALERIRAITGSRPTAASQSVQLLWLARNDPSRLDRIAHALRLKEWLFLSLTGSLLGEPGAALPVWGDWRTGTVRDDVAGLLNLPRGSELLPDFLPVGECRAALSGRAAEATGLLSGTPVLLGPGDVQATLIGLGLGIRASVTRASIFGTSAIHACHTRDPSALPEQPGGAMIQQFVLGDGYLCFHPSFNGASFLQHVRRMFAGVPETVEPSYSSLLFHPFFEAGGERAPFTDPDAAGAAVGLTAVTRPEQIAWAAREALAFVARKSHDMMNAPAGALSMGGGLAADTNFARFLATVTRSPVKRPPSGHAGLRGLAAIGAKFFYGESDAALAERWIGAAAEVVQPQSGEVADYADGKFALFSQLADSVSPAWADMSRIRDSAEGLMGSRGT
ncbi:FGGY family carbohydrate kinase [Mesorhizobium sp. L-8-3]|uniref:FGGY family carbohydrate kinase n=1 Tax=Mesorhizobium sp. L-8-3 TaxID=2744522 RepID=UPI0019274D7D|nr:FGGY family carbohydrate kinase [Mesorhizobium sp. L-8-3]BCH27343.1 carbohydrate kinase [Mesorhizobium sp. L-8-3]